MLFGFGSKPRCSSGTHRSGDRCVKINSNHKRESVLQKSSSPSRPLRPIIPYFGGKTRASDKIISKFPKEYNTYVEPFVGGGSVYWKETNANKYVINDKNKDIYRLYKNAKNSPKSVKNCVIHKASKVKFNSIRNKTNKSACDTMYLYKHSYGGTGKYFANKNRIINNNFSEKHYEKLNKTKVLNKDFRPVIKDNDHNGTLIYLDPPYVKGGENYYTNGVKPKEVCDAVRRLKKAKAIISYDNNQDVKRSCRGLNFSSISIKYSDHKNGGVSNKLNKELLITNY